MCVPVLGFIIYDEPFSIDEEKMKKPAIKKPTTYADQVNLLISRNLMIEDPALAEKELSLKNYYRLMGYAYHYYDWQNGTYSKTLTFNKLLKYYDADDDLRLLILSYLNRIEVEIKTRIANSLSLYHGNGTCYLDRGFYKSNDAFYKNLALFRKETTKNRDKRFIKHHIQKYNGVLPFWVIVEILTFGSVSKLYQNMSAKNKKTITSQFNIKKIEVLESWFQSLSTVRNTCSHCNRLFKNKIAITPQNYSSCSFDDQCKYTLFNTLRLIVLLSTCDNIELSLIDDIEKFEERHTEIDLEKDYYFPAYWKSDLTALASLLS